MKRSEAYPSQYLSQEDVRAGPIRGTIADVRIETLGRSDDADEKPVIHFQDKGMKNFPLNLTNWQTIEEVYGPESDAWAGKVIELYLDPGIKFGNQKVGGVRLRIPGGAAGGKPAHRVEEVEPLDFDQAVVLAEKAGMSKEAFTAALKARGLKDYGKTRDAAVARDIISTAAEAVEDTIPF